MHSRLVWEAHLRQFKPVAGKTLLCIGATPEEDRIYTFGENEPSWNLCSRSQEEGLHVELLEGNLRLRGIYITQVCIGHLSDMQNLLTTLSPEQRSGIVMGTYDVFHGQLQEAV